MLHAAVRICRAHLCGDGGERGSDVCTEPVAVRGVEGECAGEEVRMHGRKGGDEGQEGIRRRACGSIPKGIQAVSSFWRNLIRMDVVHLEGHLGKRPNPATTRAFKLQVCIQPIEGTQISWIESFENKELKGYQVYVSQFKTSIVPAIPVFLLWQRSRPPSA
ncbi:hypothetical protein B0H11DRAFT_1929532 [Mycena galericulata]|nr:hypothetical protein B0H11DRAFT_1929532 [Mycena galericulata]